MNNQLARLAVEEAIRKGVTEFCLCPGSRNSPLIYALMGIQHINPIKIYTCFEERSSAFFALGRIKATHRPVAVVSTSGTACAEFLPATMEAYYTSLPLLLMTADRPRCYRGSGAPQSAEQVGLYSGYVHYEKDVAAPEECNLQPWSCQGPAHLNVCFESPSDAESKTLKMNETLIKDLLNRPHHFNYLEQKKEPLPSFQHLNFIRRPTLSLTEGITKFKGFLKRVRYPLVVVGALPQNAREMVIQFLGHLNAPVYAEGISGIREEPRLAHLRISTINKVWKMSEEANYPIDGILRLGGIPTARLWRDLEDKKNKIEVCSVSEYPFSGLSWEGVTYISLATFCAHAQTLPKFNSEPAKKWLENDQAYYQYILDLFHEEPMAEPSLVHELSKIIPAGSRVYLGNSLPIREWDLAAAYENRHFSLEANRGLNGIDGQVSTFLGFSADHPSNWALLGDLTALYDMTGGGWMLTKLPYVPANLVILNNRGGQIFSRMYSHPVFLHEHHLDFKHLAAFCGLPYEKWDQVPETGHSHQRRLIELVPNPQATHRFWEKLAEVPIKAAK